MDINTFYGIVSYAVGVSLILTVAGIKWGRRFFHLFNRRHAARHTGQILGHGDGRQEEPLELADLMGGLESTNRLLTDNPEVNPNLEVFGQESDRCSSSSRF